MNMTSTSSSSITVTDFTDKIIDKLVYFKIICLNESFYVWVGLEPKLSNMAVAMPSKNGSIPSSSSLFGSKSETNSSTLAQKLAKRFNKQVFVSCSVPFEQQLSLMIEKRLSQELGSLMS